MSYYYVKKVPFVMQMEALECGAASLSMILAYHGKWLPLERVREDCGVSRDGSSAKSIVMAARNYGLKAVGYRMEPEMLKDIKLPAILHWNFNHFVVFNGFKKDKAVINDPGIGTVEVSLEEFDRSFTGVVLQFEPTEKFVPGGKPPSVLTFARERLKGTLPAFVFVVLTGILIALIGVVTPLFSKVFMDNIISGKNPEWLIPFVIAFLAVIVFQFIVAVIESVYWLRIEGRFAVTANAQFMWHILRLPIAFYSQRYTGDIVSRLGSNQMIAGTLIRQLAPVLMNVLLLIIYLTIMIQYSVLLTMIGVGAAFMNMAVVRYTAKKQVDLQRAMQTTAGKLSGITMSGIGMIETIKAAGAEVGYFERWAGYFAKEHNARVKSTRFNIYYDALPAFFQQITSIAILMLGVYLIMDGNFTIGTLLAFQGFLGAFMSPVNQLIGVGQGFITMRSSMERVQDVMNYEADPVDNVENDEHNENDENDENDDNVGINGDTDSAAAAEIEDDFSFAPLMDKLTGAIEIRNLNFGYNKLTEPIIKDFSISIKPGSSVAFVGGSGCGKSTIAKVLTGLYEHWSGEILFDGKKRSEYSNYIFKSSVAMVDQEITLFEDTVANNIRMWDTSIEDFAVIMAARDADIHDTIISRTEGYNHVIKEGGKNFSGGQQQRIEIARVLAQEPTIIILDEATSALDAKTEAEVMQNIRNIGATCLVIAHRLSTIRDCDEIVVLDKGLVVERGTHEQLYALGGRYKELVTSD